MKRINIRYAILSIALIAFIAVGISSCTQNTRAKNLGGTAEMTLPKGEKLIQATWKDDNLWYLTRPMVAGEKAETYKFKEVSSFGNFEGTYIIHESK